MIENPLSIDSLIFDLDGTLWDSSSEVSDAWTRAIRKLEAGQYAKRDEISRADVERIMGMPHEQVFATIFPNSSPAERESLARLCYKEEIDRLLQSGAPLYAGVAEGLSRLKTHFPLFIVSNCQAEYLSVFFSGTGFGPLFTDSECHGATGLAKWENIELLCRRNQLQSPVYIGDTAGDQRAALRAGVPYYHVDYGFGSPDFECLRFKNFDELVTFFLTVASVG